MRRGVRPAALTLLAAASIGIVGCGGGASTQQVHGRVFGGTELQRPSSPRRVEVPVSAPGQSLGRR